MTQDTLNTIRKTASAVYHKTPNSARGTLGKDDLASIGTLAVLEAGETTVPVHTIAYKAMIDAIRHECGRRPENRRTMLPYDETMEQRGVESRNHRLVDCEMFLSKLPENVAEPLTRHILDGLPYRSSAERMRVTRCMERMTA